jgi:hypothetical protein
MKCRASLCLSSSEIARAKEMGNTVEVGTKDGTNSWHCDVNCESVGKALEFLHTVVDLRGYSDAELEDYYIREQR